MRRRVADDGTTGTDKTSGTTELRVSDVPIVPSVSFATFSAAFTPGSVMVNVEPLPSADVTVMSPPIAFASWRQKARPSPVPPWRASLAFNCS